MRRSLPNRPWVQTLPILGDEVALPPRFVREFTMMMRNDDRLRLPRNFHVKAPRERLELST
jgi:hypothetical protein